jgi:hypothetical protein
MQRLRKGGWSAITKVKVLSPEICLNVALGQEVLYSEARIAVHDIGECVSGVPGSESIAGHSTVHNGTWESHAVLERSIQQAEEARRMYGGMAVGATHIRGVAQVMFGGACSSLEGVGSMLQRGKVT